LKYEMFVRFFVLFYGSFHKEVEPPSSSYVCVFSVFSVCVCVCVCVFDFLIERTKIECDSLHSQTYRQTDRHTGKLYSQQLLEDVKFELVQSQTIDF
jgi:hypothetical protein